MSFKIGDRVVIVWSLLPERIGQVATIESDLFLCPISTLGDRSLWLPGELPAHGMVHDLSLRNPGSDVPVAYPPEFLSLYRPDDRESIAWTSELKRLCRVKENADG